MHVNSNNINPSAEKQSSKKWNHFLRKTDKIVYKRIKRIISTWYER
jgi:hypothetical protein